jgi:hypothetical protein
LSRLQADRDAIRNARVSPTQIRLISLDSDPGNEHPDAMSLNHSESFDLRRRPFVAGDDWNLEAKLANAAAHVVESGVVFHGLRA